MKDARARLLVAIAVAALASGPVSAPAQTGSGQVIKTAKHAELGAYLVDGAGMSLYLFEEDRRQGDRGRAAESDCVDDCLGRWPPVIADRLPVAEADAEASAIGSFTRPDGLVQATYHGWPIYYFAEDLLPGDTNGHELEEFGGEWYLLTPAGAEVGQRADD